MTFTYRFNELLTDPRCVELIAEVALWNQVIEQD